MRAYSLTHLGGLAAIVQQDRSTTAVMLALIAEVDARRLFVPAGFPSMFAYCTQELHLSEDATWKRIQAARTARQFPAIFPALAEGRLHLSAVVLLAPHLTSQNAQEMINAAAHKTKSEIELLLAQRFPRTELLPMVETIATSKLPVNRQPAPGQVGTPVPADQPAPGQVGAPVPADQPAPGQVGTRVQGGIGTLAAQSIARQAPPTGPSVVPLSSETFALHLSIGKGTHEKLRYAQELLSSAIPSGDLAEVLDRALDSLIGQLEKQKFAATDRPQARPRRSTTSPRHIPAQVKRAVWECDQGQCTFVSKTGHRCGARKFLEFDHAEPVARGGQATVGNMRLRCRAHNQHEAECAFGAGFMNEKRATARHAAEEARVKAAEARRAGAAERGAATAAVAQAAAAERGAAAAAVAQAAAAEQALAADVIACMRTLGYRADESRRAAAFSATQGGATLEDRVRLALSYFRPKARSFAPAASLGRAP